MKLIGPESYIGKLLGQSRFLTVSFFFCGFATIDLLLGFTIQPENLEAENLLGTTIVSVLTGLFSFEFNKKFHQQRLKKSQV